MHTFGKVMIWLTAILGIAVVILSGRVIQKRNEWMDKVAKARVANEDLAKKLEERKLESSRLKAEYINQMLLWDRYLTDIPVTLQGTAADPILDVQAGSTQGIGVPETPEKPVLHLFMPKAEGGYLYVGPMQVTTPRENQSGVKPTWGVRPNDQPTWRSGNWRVRTMIPAPYVDQFRRLQDALAEADTQLADKKKNLAIQTNLVAEAQKHLKVRQEELLGFENPPEMAEILDPEESKGYVAALALEEQERDADLAEVDRLRRAIKEQYRKQERLVARNARLAASLPGAQVPAAEPKAQVSSK